MKQILYDIILQLQTLLLQRALKFNILFYEVWASYITSLIAEEGPPPKN